MMHKKFLAVAGLALLTLTSAACAKDGSAKDSSSSSSGGASDSGLPAILASVDGQNITLDEIRARVGSDLDQIETNYLRSRSKTVETTLQTIIRERVIGEEAKKQGKTLDELVLAEAGGTFEPSDVEISTWYRDNQERVGGRTLEQVRVQVADFLRRKRRADAEAALERRLNDQRKVVVNFQPYRIPLNNEGAPSLGKPTAPVTVVEFSDFQCPFCRQFAPNLKLIEKNFGDKVHLVYRQYPIPSLHPFAIKAAEASLCAHEQDKFWEIHDLIFAEQQRMSVTDLKEKAGRVGLDRKKFDTCLDTGRYTEQVQKDMQEGSRAGITGTPAVFINGIEVPGGAVPYETLAAAIQKEIDRAGSTKP